MTTTIERLTPHELVELWPGRRGWPQTVGALSYAGCLAVTVTSDPELHPDVETFVRALRRAGPGLG